MYNSLSVGEDEEVSIKEVTDSIVKAVGFEGDYTVCVSTFFSPYVMIDII